MSEQDDAQKYLVLDDNNLISQIIQPSWKNIHFNGIYKDSFEIQIIADEKQGMVPFYLNFRKNDLNIVLNSIYQHNWQTEHVHKYASHQKITNLDIILYKIGQKNILIKITLDDFSDRYLFQINDNMSHLLDNPVEINIKCKNNMMDYCLNISTLEIDNISHFKKPLGILDDSLTNYASYMYPMTYKIHDNYLSHYNALNTDKPSILILFIYDISKNTINQNIFGNMTIFKDMHTGYWSRTLFGLCSFDSIYNDKLIKKFTVDILNSKLHVSKTFDDSIKNYDDPVAACLSSIKEIDLHDIDVILPIRKNMYLSPYVLKWLYYATIYANNEKTKTISAFGLTSIPYQFKKNLPIGVNIVHINLKHDQLDDQVFAFTSSVIFSFLNQKITNLHTVDLSKLWKNANDHIVIYSDFSDISGLDNARFVSIDNDQDFIKDWHWMMSVFPKEPFYFDSNANYDPKNHWEHDIQQIVTSLETSIPKLGLYGGFLMINEGFFEMTSSWVCNAIAVCGNSYPIERTTLICTDQPCLRKAYNTRIYNRFGGIIGIDLQKHANQLLSDYIKSTNINVEFKKEMGFSQIGYIAMMMMRAKIIYSVAAEGVPFMLFETDAVWGADAFQYIDKKYINLDKSITDQEWDLIYYHDNPTPNGVGGGFFIQSGNEKAKTFYAEWIRMLEQDFESSLKEARDYEHNKGGITWKEQSALQQLVGSRPNDNPIQPGFGGTRILLLSQEEFVRGLWYESHNPLSLLKKEIVIQNNYIIGIESKIQRAKRYNHWFLRDDQQSCMLSEETQMIINIDLPSIVSN